MDQHLQVYVNEKYINVTAYKKVGLYAILVIEDPLGMI